MRYQPLFVVARVFELLREDPLPPRIVHAIPALPALVTAALIHHRLLFDPFAQLIHAVHVSVLNLLIGADSRNSNRHSAGTVESCLPGSQRPHLPPSSALPARSLAYG